MDVHQIIVWILAIVGAASLMVQAFVKIAAVTPNTKDDKVAAKLSKWLGFIVAALDKLALNLPANEARKSDKDQANEDHRDN